jgi:hypothetical protein
MSEDVQELTAEEKHESWLESGKWAGMTLGELVSNMIDGGGGDDVPFVRVTEQTERNDQGEYIMQMEIRLVPNGQVIEEAAKIGCNLFHNRLIEAINKGLVK